MNLAPRNEPEAFVCQDADHIHSGAVGCTRRTVLGGLAALGAGARVIPLPVSKRTNFANAAIAASRVAA
jgi:hypothetical protein